MSKTHIVIPIGIGAEGTPVQEYLEKSVNCILNQSSKDFILTVAADSNVPDRCKIFLEQNNIDVEWFEPYSFFRKGSFFRKISETWKRRESKYIAFLHYDDLWDLDKLKIQVDLMESEGLLGSWSEAYIINKEGDVTSGDYSFRELNSGTVGTRSMAFAHTIIVEKDSMLSSGIMDYEDDWAAIFEDVWAVYFHKLKKVKRAAGSKFFWRNHDLNVSYTLHEDTTDAIYQRSITGYSFDETMSDSRKIDLERIRSEVRMLYV